MKKLWLVLAITSLSGIASADWKKSVSDGFSDAVQFSKDAYSDVKDSVVEVKDSVVGEKKEKESQYVDIDSLLTFEQNIEFSITKVTKPEEDYYTINVGLKNLATKPARLVDIYKAGDVMLLDKEGFAYPLSGNLVNGTSNKQQIIVPKDAGIRAKWIFMNVEATPASIRIFGKDIPIQQ